MSIKYKVLGIKYMGVFAFLFFTTYYLLPTTFALDSTASSKVATASGAPNSLEQKLSELKSEIASKAAQLKSQITKKTQNKAYAGSVSETSESKLIIVIKNGNVSVLVNEYTEYADNSAAKNKKFTLKNIVKDNFVVALGDVDDKNNLVAKKVIKLDKPKDSNRKIIFGQIQSAQNQVINVKNKDSQKITISTNGSTSYSLGSNDASFIDVKANKYLVASGTSNPDTQMLAKYIFLVPTIGYIKPENPKAASQSAIPQAPVKK